MLNPRNLAVLAVVLSMSLVLSLPTSSQSNDIDAQQHREVVPASAEPKPEIKVTTQHQAQSDGGDDYAMVYANWKEPPAEKVEELLPQTGSLVQLFAKQVSDDLAPKDPSQTTSSILATAAPPPTQIQDLIPPSSNSSIEEKPIHPNPPSVYYPIAKDNAQVAYADSKQLVASVPVEDPKKKDVFGVYGDPAVFDRPENPHPMEVLTPLPDNQPCDPTRSLNVIIPPASITKYATPVLPSRFGCSSAKDSSREKLSPEITWNNVTEDVFEFSLQMIQMGDNCLATGSDYGKILWHVTGIKGAHEIRFQEGASHDKRLLNSGVEQPNQWLEEYYSGPCPAPGTIGCYRFKVLAHRANGWCQCGYQDVLFERPALADMQ